MKGIGTKVRERAVACCREQQGRRWLGLLLCLLLASGCFPTKAAKSAGPTGCLPGEIEISDLQRNLGVIESADTWLATCQGRTYVCTEVINMSGDTAADIQELLPGPTPRSVSCHEEAESIQEPSREPPRRRDLDVATTPPPTGVAGFDFGMSEDDARRRCEASGHAFTSDGGASACSGVAASIGVPASVKLSFCQARTCGVALEHRPSGGWSKAVVQLKTQLEGKYGPTQSETQGIPEQCRTESDFVSCLESRALSLHYGWRWPTGQAVDLDVGKPSADASSAIRLVYTNLARQVPNEAL